MTSAAADESQSAPSDTLESPEISDASIRNDFANVIRGFFMGAADVVPGVSGGTVALILGHYQRLITAISHFDMTFFVHAKSGRLADAARHIDLRFLVALGLGVAVGIVSLAGAMHFLLDQHMPPTLAAFSGLIAASIWIVRRFVARWSVAQYAAVVIGIAVAVGITLSPAGDGSMSLLYLFGAASIAICAMILPGISGAFILLLLGIYHPVTGLIKSAVKGDFTTESITQIVVFAAGCGFGLLCFSKLLRWLLKTHHDTTMAVLIGLMAGSLLKLWPLQIATPETAELKMKLREFVYVTPAEWSGSLVMLLGIAIASGVAVLAADRMSRQTG